MTGEVLKLDAGRVGSFEGETRRNRNGHGPDCSSVQRPLDGADVHMDVLLAAQGTNHDGYDSFGDMSAMFYPPSWGVVAEIAGRASESGEARRLTPNTTTQNRIG